MSESTILIKEYSKNPVNNHKMKDADISQHEGNFICGDDITVYLKIQNDKIVGYSFDGDCSNITKAGASFLAELIENKPIKDILQWTYTDLQKEGFEVSNRRKRAAVIALLATRNAIHIYQNDEVRDEFDDLILDY